MLANLGYDGIATSTSLKLKKGVWQWHCKPTFTQSGWLHNETKSQDSAQPQVVLLILTI